MTNSNYTVKPKKGHKKIRRETSSRRTTLYTFNQQTLFQRFDIQFYRANHVLWIQNSIEVFFSKNTFFKH